MKKDYTLPQGHQIFAFADPKDTRRVIQVQHRPGVPALDGAILDGMRSAADGRTIYREGTDAQTIANQFQFAGQKVPRKLVHVRVYFNGKPSNILTIPGDLMALICDNIVAIQPDDVSEFDVRQAHVNAVFSEMPW